MTTIEQHIRRIKLFEGYYTRRVYHVLHAEFIEAAEVVREKGIVALRQHIDKLFFMDGMGKLLRSLYIQVGLWAGNRTLRDIRQSVKEAKAGFGFDAQWTAEIINFFRIYLLTKAVVPITRETRAQILQVLEKAETEGWGIDRIAKELESSELTLWRARMIARTEIAKAHFYGIQLGEQGSEYETTKEWLSAHDHRVRHSHRDVDKTVIDSDSRFRVPRYKRNVIIGYDLMRGPGDPEASAGNVINCRCTVAVRAARDARGRIIPRKARNSQISITLPVSTL